MRSGRKRSGRKRVNRMREDFDTSFGKFDSPMAAFLYERVMLAGDFGDDEYSDGEGMWGSRYGRRVLEGDDRGFVYYVRFDTVEEAAVRFREVAAVYEEGQEAE
jgi:hypothetical protein